MLTFPSFYDIYAIWFYNLFIKLMAASFASRLSGLRQTKTNLTQNQQGNLRLTMPDTSAKSSYEPSSSASNSRGSFRLLKGRIDRQQSTQKPDLISTTTNVEKNQMRLTGKLSLADEPPADLKLVLQHDPSIEEKKPINQPPKIPLQKRILITKEAPKEEPRREEPPPKREEPRKDDLPPQPKIERQNSRQLINQEEKPIHEEEHEETLPPESENDLVMCPEGCGRKFNRKALEKHSKACKLVFMSKRKQFNSEAKRVISKEQADATKQTKLEEKKKMGMTRGKGFDKTKTGDNWKAASEDFRSAIRGMKKEEPEDDVDIEEVDINDKKVVLVDCQYCQKKFNEVFIEKHLENCIKKKDKDRNRSQKRPPKK